MVSQYTGVPLTRVEQVGVLVSTVGLCMLAISLAGAHGQGGRGSYAAVGVWLGGSFAVALTALRVAPRRIGGGPAFGLATGILFAAGDVRSQLTRQITTAVGDATTAAIAVEKYLAALREKEKAAVAS